MSKAIHIHNDNGTFRIVERRADRKSEREWARYAMFALMGELDGPGLPLALPHLESTGCPPVPKVKYEKINGIQPGGRQNWSVAPIVRAPARQASSINSVWTPPHYHKFFCAHDRFRGLPCMQCGRNTAEGREWLDTV